jgi:ferredoxin--NADP+ reductase
MMREKLIYYPTVTREPFRNRGRLTDLITSGQLFTGVELVMMCGSPKMLKDLVPMVRRLGFAESNHSEPAQYVVEKAFVEK